MRLTTLLFGVDMFLKREYQHSVPKYFFKSVIQMIILLFCQIVSRIRNNKSNHEIPL